MPPGGRACRSGHWPGSTGCIAVWYGRRCPLRCRSRADRRYVVPRGWSRSRRGSTTGCARTWKRWRKQRYTVRRIVSSLGEELGADVPYPTVRDYVSARRPQIAAEAGAPADGFIVRHNRPGADAEVDFGEVWVNLSGTMTRCYLFALRLAYSGKAVHRISVSCGEGVSRTSSAVLMTPKALGPMMPMPYERACRTTSRWRSRPSAPFGETRGGHDQALYTVLAAVCDGLGNPCDPVAT